MVGVDFWESNKGQDDCQDSHRNRQSSLGGDRLKPQRSLSHSFRIGIVVKAYSCHHSIRQKERRVEDTLCVT